MSGPEDCDPWEEEQGDCQRCNNEGRIMICVDDTCRGSGECMYGPSGGPHCFAICPECKWESI